MDHSFLRKYFLENPCRVSDVVEFDRDVDRLLPFDFTERNRSLSPETISDTSRFTEWVEEELGRHACRYGIGGYNEHRTLYARSAHFDSGEEPRRLHLGVDIWGPAGTPVFCPHDGRVHSFRFNDHFGDYGATIILEHDIAGHTLHTLYGHLDLESLSGLEEGRFVAKGQRLASLGRAEENGNWPPHLHFQLILDMENNRGDYPGVCRFSERAHYLANCPDPIIILHANFN